LIQKWLVVSTHTKQSENPLWGLENMIWNHQTDKNEPWSSYPSPIPWNSGCFIGIPEWNCFFRWFYNMPICQGCQDISLICTR
jgi:hypothetical protein